MRFRDRHDAGRHLAERLESFRGESPVVVGLARGGVPVAAEVAEALNAPLEVLVVRKLGVLTQPELAMGAVAEGGRPVLNDDVIRRLGIRAPVIEAVIEREVRELERRTSVLRGVRPPRDMRGRTVLIIDDGIATGSSALAACRAVKAMGATTVVVAAPVAPGDGLRLLAGEADDVIAILTPRSFAAVGQFYVDFSPTSESEVRECLDSAANRGQS